MRLKYYHKKMFATAVGLRYRAPDTGRFRALRMGKFRKGGFNYFLLVMKVTLICNFSECFEILNFLHFPLFVAIATPPL